MTPTAALATGSTPVQPAASPGECTVSAATGSTGTNLYTVTAQPDDALDDTPGIQGRIDAAGAAGGGIVRIPAGTFIINGKLRMASNVKLEGAGPATVLKAGPGFLGNTGPAGGYPIITTAGADNTTLANFTADQSGDTLNGNVPGRLNEYVVDVRDSHNSVVEGIQTRNPFTYSIAFVGGSNWCVRNSSTQSETNGKYTELDGIHAMNTSHGDIVGNVVDQRKGTDGDDGIAVHTFGTEDVHDIRITNNNVRGGRHGAGIDLAGGSGVIYNIDLTGNTVWGSPRGLEDAYYDGTKQIHHIKVLGNTFRDNDIKSVGGAVDFERPVTYVTMTDNVACNSGGYRLPAGLGNTNLRNMQTSLC
ncbi:glycosyl hydrolase family 28-related protein [Paenarthrobacter sp. NPDC057355]|uniref:glycosyl hydrolase family 28-related protein n=1 Tax=Paenarthrobacter sp. NPDC057355 TaxID=3346105 RepID=UPI003643CA10